MRVLVSLSIAGAVLLAIAFVRSQQGGRALVHGEVPKAEEATASKRTDGDVDSRFAAVEQERSTGSMPAAETAARVPAALPMPRSAVNWSYDLASAMTRAQHSGRLLLLYIAPSAGT